MSLSPKRKTPNPCQGKGLHGQELGKNQLLGKYRMNQLCFVFSLPLIDTKT